MTVDELWYEVLQAIDDKSNPNSVAGKHLRKLIEGSEGQVRFRRGLKEKLKHKTVDREVLRRELATVRWSLAAMVSHHGENGLRGRLRRCKAW